MHHLYKMSRARRPAMQIPLFGCSRRFFPSWRAWNVSSARRQSLENGIEMLDDVRRPANHHAIAALQSPDSAARANIRVFYSSRAKFFRAANVVDVIGISAV